MNKLDTCLTSYELVLKMGLKSECIDFNRYEIGNSQECNKVREEMRSLKQVLAICLVSQSFALNAYALNVAAKPLLPKYNQLKIENRAHENIYQKAVLEKRLDSAKEATKGNLEEALKIKKEANEWGWNRALMIAQNRISELKIATKEIATLLYNLIRVTPRNVLNSMYDRGLSAYETTHKKSLEIYAEARKSIEQTPDRAKEIMAEANLKVAELYQKLYESIPEVSAYHKFFGEFNFGMFSGIFTGRNLLKKTNPEQIQKISEEYSVRLDNNSRVLEFKEFGPSGEIVDLLAYTFTEGSSERLVITTSNKVTAEIREVFFSKLEEANIGQVGQGGFLLHLKDARDLSAVIKEAKKISDVFRSEITEVQSAQEVGFPGT